MFGWFHKNKRNNSVVFPSLSKLSPGDALVIPALLAFYKQLPDGVPGHITGRYLSRMRLTVFFDDIGECLEQGRDLVDFLSEPWEGTLLLNSNRRLTAKEVTLNDYFGEYDVRDAGFQQLRADIIKRLERLHNLFDVKKEHRNHHVGCWFQDDLLKFTLLVFGDDMT